MKNRRTLVLALLVLLALTGLASAGETLYNGIVLPQMWPPQYPSILYEPMPVPYLDNPPTVIPIDVGRQLFVDDFLIETTTMTQTYHQATYHSNPVIAPETTVEIDSEGNWFAAPFSGGAWYDPGDSLFKLWYHGGSAGELGGKAICYATSTDGVSWVKPNLDVNPAGLLHHFTCTPSNPSVNDQVTINAYDQYDQQLDLADWDIIEFCFFGGAGCVEIGSGTITIDGSGGAVFTVTQAMLDDGKSFDFNAYAATSPPETELFKLPFPFDTIERGGNAVYPFAMGDENHIDSTSILLDHNAPAAERFKYFATEFPGHGAWLTYRTSPDGIHWSAPQSTVPVWGDRTTVLYNPFRDVWVCSQRTEDALGRRARSYVEGLTAADLMSRVTYNELDTVEGDSVHWVGADYLDPHHTDPLYSHIDPQLYTLDAAPYESIMLGQFSIWQGPYNWQCGEDWVPKRNDILLGFSRDGFHWDRSDRTRFITSTWTEPSWRFGNVQSVVGGPLVVGDELYFYFSARPKPAPDAPGWDADGRTGLAVLRRDGFASMDAGGSTETLTTRPVSFQGTYLFVNVDCPQGQLRVEVLDEDSHEITPFTLANSDPISSDTTMAQVTWGQHDDLSALSSQPVRFRFSLTDGSLYAFWVSPDKSGASYGYVGAGGPGFTGPTDTVGQGEPEDDDGDGLTNDEEIQLGTDPDNPDTDNDGLLDGEEVNAYSSDPLDADTDDDGLLDGHEVYDYGTDPANADTDQDGLPDNWEVDNSLDPLADDSAGDADNDTLNNLDEFGAGTDPNDPDTDDDGHSDGTEVSEGSDPTDPQSTPPARGGAGGPCFIATAAYGTPSARQVGALREFRDRYLLTNRAGAACVKAYYRLSPQLAGFIAGHDLAAHIARAGVSSMFLLLRLMVCSPFISALALSSALLGIGLGVRQAAQRGSYAPSETRIAG